MSKRKRVCICRITFLLVLMSAIIGAIYALCRFAWLRHAVALFVVSLVIALMWEAVEEQ